MTPPRSPFETWGPGPDGFRSRRDAGRQLGERLAGTRAARPIVLGLPRGGVPLADEVARALGAPLDVVLVRKLAVPQQPELALGAIAEGGARVVNGALLRALGLDESALAPVEARAVAEMERRARRFRGASPPPALDGRVVILVDDGAATGATARAAVRAVRAAGATRVVVALGVASGDAVDALAAEADEVVALRVPEPFGYVGAWYDDFRAVSDDEVARLLARERGSG